jgi:hypothetical protein
MHSGGTIMVALSGDNELISKFIAPNVRGWVSFLLTVTNSNGETDTDTVCILIESHPSADAGPDQTVVEGDAVFLDASLSFDPTGIISSYQWAQISGISASIDSYDGVKLSFTAPVVDFAETLTFQLIVMNNYGGSDTDTVNINVNNDGMNIPPTADAGIDQTIAEKDIVVLDASKSFDPDGLIRQYVWEQTDDSDFLIPLSDRLSVAPTFKSPEVDKTTIFHFTLTVQDNNGSIDTDDVTIIIEDTDDSSGGGSCFISIIDVSIY